MTAETFPQIELDGRYARLVPLSSEHAGALSEAANISRKTFNLTGVPVDVESARQYIQRALDQYKNRTSLPFAIVEKKSGKIIGTSRYMNIEFWDYPADHQLKRPAHIPHALEIGSTWLAEPYQRTGINTDAKLQLLTYAFEVWQVLRVSLKTDARNVRSRTNIERVGAKFDGVVRAHMPSFDGGIRDTAFYSILSAEWPQVKSSLAAKLR